MPKPAPDVKTNIFFRGYASASQTQADTPFMYLFMRLLLEMPEQTFPNISGAFYWNQAVRWTRSGHVHCQRWPAPSGEHRLSGKTSTSEVSSLLTIGFGHSLCLFNISNYGHCWEQMKKVQEEFSLFCFAWPAIWLCGYDLWCLVS